MQFTDVLLVFVSACSSFISSTIAKSHRKQRLEGRSVAKVPSPMRSRHL